MLGVSLIVAFGVGLSSKLDVLSNYLFATHVSEALLRFADAIYNIRWFSWSAKYELVNKRHCLQFTNQLS